MLRYQCIKLSRNILIIESDESDIQSLLESAGIEVERYVGLLKQLKDNDFLRLVHYFLGRFKNYNATIGFGALNFKTGMESFISGLEANGIYFENPLGLKPSGSPGNTIRDCFSIEEWEEAEKKKWNRENIHVFELKTKMC